MNTARGLGSHRSLLLNERRLALGKVGRNCEGWVLTIKSAWCLLSVYSCPLVLLILRLRLIPIAVDFIEGRESGAGATESKSRSLKGFLDVEMDAESCTS